MVSTQNANALGDFIRRARKRNGMTQTRLCVGLCDVSTLSRIERGVAAPTSYIRAALLERLGYYAERDMNSLWDEDNEFVKRTRALSIAVLHRDIAAMRALIRELERKPMFSEGLGLQVVQNAKAALIVYQFQSGCRKDLGDCLRMLRKSLSITIPGFAEDKIRDYYLTSEEMRGINILSGFYFHGKEYEKALNVSLALRDNIKNHSFSIYERSLYYGKTMINITEYYFRLKRYDECIAATRECIDFYVNFYEYDKASSLLFTLGKCLAELGGEDNAKNALKSSFFAAHSFNNKNDFDEIADYYRDMFREEIDRSPVGAVPRNPERAAGHVIEHVTEHVTEHDETGERERVNALVSVMGGEPATAKTLMEKLNLSSRPNFIYNYLKPAIRAGRVEMTNPGSPRSRGQRYRAAHAPG